MSRCMPSPSSSSRLTSSSVLPPTAPQQRGERRSRVGQQRGERQVCVEEQPGRSSQAPAPQLVRDPSRGIAAHVTCARRVASAAVTATVSAALAVAMTTDSGSWRSNPSRRQLVDEHLGRLGRREDAVLDADERDGEAAQLERLRERQRGADRHGELLTIRDPVVADADGMDHVRGGQRARLGGDGGPGGARALVDRVALDLVASVALHRRGGAGGHEQRFVRRDDERVDLELSDLPLPDVDLDACHACLRSRSRRRGQSTPRWSRGRRSRSAVVTS